MDDHFVEGYLRAPSRDQFPKDIVAVTSKLADALQFQYGEALKRFIQIDQKTHQTATTAGALIAVFAVFLQPDKLQSMTALRSGDVIRILFGLATAALLAAVFICIHALKIRVINEHVGPSSLRFFEEILDLLRPRNEADETKTIVKEFEADGLIEITTEGFEWERGDCLRTEVRALVDANNEKAALLSIAQALLGTAIFFIALIVSHVILLS
ncbi:MAG: hypothetical protein IH602_11410 [Bryobacteraceae bacterium]|nr:hypothetical protein [Bryobacteraceae bacterium]